jgi:restriction system protein
MPPAQRTDVPPYSDLIYPVLKAVEAFGGSAQAGQITAKVIEDSGFSDDLVALTYDNRPKSILIDRTEWARSYAKLGGALDSPRRGLYLLSPLGQEILSKPAAEGIAAVKELNRTVRIARAQARVATANAVNADDVEEAVPEEEEDDTSWTEALLNRLHQLSPVGFERFVMLLLRSYDLQLEHVGGTGDQGIDGIGIAPISPVLSSRVAVQAKRYDPSSTVGRETVALFQRDAATAGAERAVLVTLGRFSEPARQASISTTPTVDLIDGQRLCELVRDRELGVRVVPQVQENFFDRFDNET